MMEKPKVSSSSLETLKDEEAQFLSRESPESYSRFHSAWKAYIIITATWATLCAPLASTIYMPAVKKVAVDLSVRSRKCSRR